jgi:SAM-dependent methyltransferase
MTETSAYPTASAAVDATATARATAAAYDTWAVRYAELARDSLDALPLDRAFLAALADLVLAGSAGPVAELGCGPGHVTAYLRDLGLDAFGVDLSTALIDIARETNPDLRFEVCSMDALDVVDGALDGIVCWYSIIHTAPGGLPAYFAEFRRVLAPGGHLLLAFFESEGDRVTEFDHRVAPAYRWPVDDLAALARDADFVEVGRMLREPSEQERFRRGHLILRRS